MKKKSLSSPSPHPCMTPSFCPLPRSWPVEKGGYMFHLVGMVGGLMVW